MPKTITLRLEDNIYQLLRKAADGERRNISNYIEYAALNYLVSETYVSDEEMEDILNDKSLVKSLKSGMKDIEKGRYKIVK